MARYEQEKVYMETLRGLGSAVGEYVGDGQAESSTQPTSADFDGDFDGDFDVVDAELGLDDHSLDDYDEDSSDNAHPLLICFDCETTGFSIYDDHITDVAAKVIDSPVPLETPTFSSLVKTSRRIPVAGNIHLILHDCTWLHLLSMKLPGSQVSTP